MRQLEDGIEAKKRQSPNTEVQSSLKQEVITLTEIPRNRVNYIQSF
jgi:hypothetical protein